MTHGERWVNLDSRRMMHPRKPEPENRNSKTENLDPKSCRVGDRREDFEREIHRGGRLCSRQRTRSHTTNPKPQNPHPKTETTNLKLRTTNHKPQTTNHKPQTTNHKPQTANHKPRTTNHQPQNPDLWGPIKARSHFRPLLPRLHWPEAGSS